MKTDPGSIMVSLSLLARVVEDTALWPHYLVGALDEDLLPAFSAHVYDAPDDEARIAQARQHLERHKSAFRFMIQSAFDGLARDHAEEVEANKRAELERIRHSMKEMNKPAPEGTVKELAARYGVSIGVVRKYKAEGRLSELELEAAGKSVADQ